MSDTHQPEASRSTRRDFLKTSGVAAGAALATTLTLAPNVHAAGSDTMKVGVVGCGGRGAGAAENVLQSSKGVEIVALGDYFEDKPKLLRDRLIKVAGGDNHVRELGNKVNIPQDQCFSGLDAYQKVINAPGVNYVILATSPGFRPVHLQAAVAAGKNVFTEKPVGVDGPGIRKVLDVYDEANKKKLGIGAGTQRRHQAGYIETIKHIHDGDIGDIVSGRCYWNQGDIWFKPRRAGMSDLDYQIYNWYHFVWLCGDHICEQHVHNLDVINWAAKEHPIRALGMGGRVRPCTDPNADGHIYNYFAIDYEYPNGLHILSMCRQIGSTDGSPDPRRVSGVSEALVGTKGSCQVNSYSINGKSVAGRRGETDPYVQEHTDLIASIRAGKPLNELRSVAESTLTAVMGRMSAYTGKAVTWEQVLNSKEDTMPAKLSRDMSLSTPPVAVPGKTPLV